MSSLVFRAGTEPRALVAAIASAASSAAMSLSKTGRGIGGDAKMGAFARLPSTNLA
jgi:hypothetical protein